MVGDSLWYEIRWNWIVRDFQHTLCLRIWRSHAVHIMCINVYFKGLRKPRKLRWMEWTRAQDTHVAPGNAAGLKLCLLGRKVSPTARRKNPYWSPYGSLHIPTHLRHSMLYTRRYHMMYSGYTWFSSLVSPSHGLEASGSIARSDSHNQTHIGSQHFGTSIHAACLPYPHPLVVSYCGRIGNMAAQTRTQYIPRCNVQNNTRIVFVVWQMQSVNSFKMPICRGHFGLTDEKHGEERKRFCAQTFGLTVQNNDTNLLYVTPPTTSYNSQATNKSSKQKASIVRNKKNQQKLCSTNRSKEYLSITPTINIKNEKQETNWQETHKKLQSRNFRQQKQQDHP